MEKTFWIGITPSPAALSQLDFEERTVLAYLGWTTVANRPAKLDELTRLTDRDDKPIGAEEVRTIIRELMDRKIISVYGSGTDRPFSVRFGGFRHKSPRPATPVRAAERRPSPGKGPSGKPVRKLFIDRDLRVEMNLSTTPKTPAYVMETVAKIRRDQLAVEEAGSPGTLVEKAETRLSVLHRRIALYERWLKDEPGHPNLAAILAKRKKAVPELEYQIERAAVKQAELAAETSGD